MQVREGMSTVVLTIGPGHTLRQASARPSSSIRTAWDPGSSRSATS